MLNRNYMTTTIQMEQYQTNTQSGEIGIQALTKLEAQLAIETLNGNEALGMDGIPAELLRHGGEEGINKIHRLVVKSRGERRNTRGV
jgi:hypothetical protein